MKTKAVGFAVMLLLAAGALAQEPVRTMRFQATTPAEAARWQKQSRAKLFELMMGGRKPKAGPLKPQLIKREVTPEGYVLEELTIQTLPDRRAHVWLALPKAGQGKWPAVLSLHGHGGTGEQMMRGQSLYWYGKAFLERGYVIISPDIGQHTLQHTNWSLMGERTWDALRCLDYLETRQEVDRRRLAVAGLSLGGETTMYVAAMDTRVKAVCSSGWLTTIDNMKRGHCPCWNFPGLEQHFDFADIFACIAPRPLVVEIGEQERAPGGFPYAVAAQAFEQIKPAYVVFNAVDKLQMDLHPEGHVFRGTKFWPVVEKAWGGK